MSHSLLSPSFAHIGYKCAAAAIRSYQVEQRTEVFAAMGADYFNLEDDNVWNQLCEDDMSAAENGTRLHNVLQIAVESKGEQDIKKLMIANGLPEDFYNDTYIVGRMTDFRDYLLEQFLQASVTYLEYKGQINGLNSGGTVDYAWVINNTLFIRDLKTGRVEIESENNDQIMTYAVIILDTLKWNKKIKKINMQAMGLRWSKPEWEVSVETLYDYKHDVVIPAYIEAHKINPVATAGDHCMHCKAKIHCEAYQTLMKNNLKNIEMNSDGFEDMDTDELEKLALTAVQAGKFLKVSKIELMKRYQGFDEPKIFKMANGRKTKTWSVDEKELVIALKDKLTNENDIYEQKLKSPSDIIKLIGDDKQVEGLIKTVTGKPFLKL